MDILKTEKFNALRNCHLKTIAIYKIYINIFKECGINFTLKKIISIFVHQIILTVNQSVFTEKI